MRGLFWGRKYTSIHLELSLVQKQNFEAGPTRTPYDYPDPLLARISVSVLGLGGREDLGVEAGWSVSWRFGVLFDFFVLFLLPLLRTELN